MDQDSGINWDVWPQREEAHTCVWIILGPTGVDISLMQSVLVARSGCGSTQVHAGSMLPMRSMQLCQMVDSVGEAVSEKIMWDSDRRSVDKQNCLVCPFAAPAHQRKGCCACTPKKG